jgi:hypothetical protein
VNDAYHHDGKVVSLRNASLPSGVWQVFTQVYGEGDPRSHRLFRDGELLIETQASAPYSVDASNISLGNYYDQGSRYLVGDVAEWIVFDRVLAPAERTAVETYLAKRAGLFRPEAGLLLSIHPAASGAGPWVLSWPGETNRQYHLERSTTLQPGSWIREQTITPTSRGIIEIELNPGEPEGAFYRLQSQ